MQQDALVFGTDGIRGRAGVPPILPATAAALGRALVDLGAPVVVARDTRRSGPELARALMAGVVERGGEAVDAGILPTPGLSALLAAGWGCHGVMITASHNPPPDNGLKVLGADGRKLTDAAQDMIQEALNRELSAAPGQSADHALPSPRDEAAAALYMASLLDALPAGCDLSGWTIVADAGNGAASRTLPAILSSLGAVVHEMNCEGAGDSINVASGAMDPAPLAAEVIRLRADAGIALDGDGDRGILVTGSGRVLDGDGLLYLLARPPGVVGTVMSGGGIEESLAARGITLHRTPVGDRHVDAAVREMGLWVGAEPSGHVCFLKGLPTADGALAVITALAGDAPLDQRLAGYRVLPRALRNVSLPQRRPLDKWTALQDAKDRAVEALGPGGRVVLRYSGTEPVLRIFVEGRDAEAVRAAAADLEATVYTRSRSSR